MRYVTASALALLVCLATGCGGGGTQGGAAGGPGGTPTQKEALTDLAELLKSVEANKQKPPARLAAVEPMEPVFPGAYIGLSKGEIVYAWGQPLSATGTGTVLAYEKGAESNGGWVLMQDGIVKQMSAEEFKAAPKAAKK